MTKGDVLHRLELLMDFGGGQKFKLPDGFVKDINRLHDDLEADIEADASAPFMAGPSGITNVDLAGMGDRLLPSVKAALATKRKGLFGFVLTPALIMMVVQIVVQLIAAFMKKDAAFALPLYQAKPDEFDPVVVAAVSETGL